MNVRPHVARDAVVYCGAELKSGMPSHTLSRHLSRMVSKIHPSNPRQPNNNNNNNNNYHLNITYS